VAGSTFELNKSAAGLVMGSGYNNDGLLRSIKAAGTVTVITDETTEYRYAAVFGRLKANYNNRYIASVTGRRDGSSRFGPGKQFANFGSMAFGWIFTSENWLKKPLRFMSYGKLRVSYGSTGNDKIGDYAFLNTYSSTGVSYGGTTGITPGGLFNPDYAWEINRKLEAAADLAFFHNKVQLTAAWYLNRSGNQLINYTLPLQTGGSGMIANFPATVRNTGLEIELSAAAVKHRSFRWNTSFNISFQENVLESFPSIETTSYNSSLLVGRSLTILTGYRFAGVNATTGLFEFYDADGKATSTPVTTDRVKGLIETDPVFFGGLSNQFAWKGWELDVFLEFRKQIGFNYFGNIYSQTSYPGTMNNQPTAMLSRWTQPGDVTNIQRYTTRAGTPAYSAANVIRLSRADVQYSDASYLRVKNVSLSYTIPDKVVNRLKLQSSRLYLHAQNLFTLTSFKGGDPETRDLFRLPPLKTITAGIQLTF
jgi:hypothetical protein